MALVSWGHRLEISKVSLEVVVDFIRDHALKGPEKISRNGQYDLALFQPAKIVSNEEDTDLCSFYGPSELGGM